MLILPPGHAEAIRTPLRLGTREKWVVSAMAAVVAALAIVLVISLGSKGHHTGNGCIDATLPYAFGGQEIYRCGAAARRACAAIDTPAGFGQEAGKLLAVECRKVNLPVGQHANA
jgi:hypothetical protein